MKLIYRGRELEVQKIEVYCKAGGYEHKMRNGWGLVNSDGICVLGDEAVLKNRCYGAMGSEYPKFTTRKSLIEFVND